MQLRLFRQPSENLYNCGVAEGSFLDHSRFIYVDVSIIETCSTELFSTLESHMVKRLHRQMFLFTCGAYTMSCLLDLSQKDCTNWQTSLRNQLTADRSLANSV